MQSISLYLKRRPHILILGLILLIALFFRTYKVIDRFEFAVDGDLYSWIVKDILINHHLRLIGQLTTASGIFIGAAWYYLITPFFLLTNMYPTAAIIPTTIIGILTVFSYYLVFSKLFNIKVGLIASFLYGVLLSNVQFDRRVVPSTPTNLWVVWYFYTIISIARGNYHILPLLGILIGLIWHIHIALIPALIAVPAAFLVAKKLPTKKQLFTFLIALFITSLPLILFETRHNFQQTVSLYNNFVAKNEGATGFFKFQQVTDMLAKNINTLFLMPQSFKFTNNFLFVLLFLISALFLVKIKVLSIKDLIPLYIWILGVILFFWLSSSPISEYYFANIEIIFLTIASLFLYLIYKKSQLGKFLVLSIFGLVLIKNTYFLITQNYYHKGYAEKKAIVKSIVVDMKARGFPCIGVSYITALGENVGFRYLFYLNDVHLIHPSFDIPVYNIFIPDELAQEEIKQKFGHIGLATPTTIPSRETIEKSCQTPDTNLTDPMLGYVD